jgi:hypothetical protein
VSAKTVISGTQSRRQQPRQQPDAANSLNAVKLAAAAATGAREVMLAVADVRAVVTMLPSLLLRYRAGLTYSQ